ISGNSFGQVGLTGQNTSLNVVQGNLIGTDKTGSTAIVVVAATGLQIDSGASNNTVGGGSPGIRNVISGNAGDGILITGPTTTANKVQGNFVGLNKAGTAGLPNGFASNGAIPTAGIHVTGAAHDNQIGGTLAASAPPGSAPGNVISGNDKDGVLIDIGLDAAD